MAKGANKKYIVKLTPKERVELQGYTRGHKVAAQKKQRACILLMTDQGDEGENKPDAEIVRLVGVSLSTVERVREYACEVGAVESLTSRRPNRVYERKLDGVAEARLVKIGCSEPPEGAARWSIRLLKDELIRLKVVDSIGDETVRTTLKKISLNLI
jgi:hypothetical protein